MNRAVLFILLLFPTFLLAQETSIFEYINYKGDTLLLKTITAPTVCDCIKKDYRNLDQKKICDKLYDYDFMSIQDKREFDARKSVCNDPSLCDCALADLNDRGLIQACDTKFDLDSFDKQEKQQVIQMMEQCSEKDLTYPKLLAQSAKETSICDCINLNDASIALRNECNTKFFDAKKLGEETIAKNMSLLQECIEKKQFSIDPTLCECKLFSETDAEFKVACAEKYDTSEMASVELIDYYLALELCNELELYTALNKINREKNFPNQNDPIQTKSFLPRYRNLYYNNDNFLPTKKYSSKVQNQIDEIALIKVCDCLHLDSTQIETMEKCMDYFRLELISEKEANLLQTIEATCAGMPDSISICNCIKIPDRAKSAEEKEKCKEQLDSLTTKELIKYLTGEESCE